MAQTVDTVIYGATLAGLVAAKRQSRRGKSVAVLEWSPSIGGLFSGGLGITDNVRNTAWGITREVLNAVVVAGSPDVQVNSNGLPVVYMPSHARAAFSTLGMLGDTNVTIYTNQWIYSVIKDGPIVKGVVTDADTFYATEFIDCSYEGDLARMAGVTTTYGRSESNQTFGEPHAGVHRQHAAQTNTPTVNSRGDLFKTRQMPPQEPDGQADAKVMAYSYRMTVSSKSDRLPWPMPPGYRREDFLDWITEMNTRNFSSLSNITSYQMCGPNKASTNGGVISGQIPWSYPATRTRADRLKVWDRIFYIMAGKYYAAANDPDSPSAMKANMALWGLPGDENQNVGEYYGTPGWSSYVYTRESNRARGRTVMTEFNMVTGSDAARNQPDPIGCGGYNPDSHPCNTYPTSDRQRVEEGRMSIDSVAGNYQIPWRAILPRPEQAINLQIVGTPSITRTVMTSYRIETTWGIIADAAANIAADALDSGRYSGSLSYSDIRGGLISIGATLNP